MPENPVSLEEAINTAIDRAGHISDGFEEGPPPEVRDLLEALREADAIIHGNGFPPGAKRQPYRTVSARQANIHERARREEIRYDVACAIDEIEQHFGTQIGDGKGPEFIQVPPMLRGVRSRLANALRLIMQDEAQGQDGHQ